MRSCSLGVPCCSACPPLPAELGGISFPGLPRAHWREVPQCHSGRQRQGGHPEGGHHVARPAAQCPGASWGAHPAGLGECPENCSIAHARPLLRCVAASVSPCTVQQKAPTAPVSSQVEPHDGDLIACSFMRRSGDNALHRRIENGCLFDPHRWSCMMQTCSPLACGLLMIWTAHLACRPR